MGVKTEDKQLNILKERPLSLEVPGHPTSMNKLWRPKRGGGFYKEAKSNRWAEVTMYSVKAVAMRLWGFSDLKAYRGHPVALDLCFYRKQWRAKAKARSHLYVRPDLSNFIKAAEDAVMDALGLDDSAVIELTCSKVERDGPDSLGICLEFLE